MIKFAKKSGILVVFVIIEVIFSTCSDSSNNPGTTTNSPILNDGIQITVAMWDSYGDGWNGAALRIIKNGVDISPNASVGSYENSRTFNVNLNDIIKFYWIRGEYDSECAFAVYYTNYPPDPPFNPNSGNWSPTNDPDGRLLLYRQYNTMNNTNNGTLLGSFTVSFSSTLPVHVADDSSIKIFLDGSPLENHGVTTFSEEAANFIVGIASGNYSEIIWYINGNVVAQGTSRTSLALSKLTSGAYNVTVEAAKADEVKNSASHTFIILYGDVNLPVLTGTVVINGIPYVNQILTANISNLGGNGDISYQWKRNGITVIGTNINTYTIQDSDVGSTIVVTVTRSGNSGTITSIPINVPNTGIIIDASPIKLYLDNEPLENGGITAFSQKNEIFNVSIAVDTYMEIIWYLNGSIVAQGVSRTSIIMSKQIPGVYQITVEAVSESGIKNSANHNFLIQ